MVPSFLPVLTFWFGTDELTPEDAQVRVKEWFMGGKAMDRKIQERFGDVLIAALKGQRDDWAESPQGRLALILVLDQFCRNVYRGRARAFSGDAAALTLALDGLARGWVDGLAPPEAQFFLMPLMHAEDLTVQHLAVDAFHSLYHRVEPAWQSMVGHSLEEALAHRFLIDVFGRFPHRNKALGRSSTKEEKTYLARSGHYYGQASTSSKDNDIQRER